MGFAEIFEKCIVPTMSGQWAPRVCDAANISKGDRVLDVGCGTGVLARTAADRLGSDGGVSGVDVSEEMLAVARRIRPGIDWRSGDACSLPFSDGEFDAVVSQFTLMFVPDPVTALKEMRRVLAPSGRVAVAVWWESPAYPVLAEIAAERIGAEVKGALLDPFCLGDADELGRLFHAAGFENAVVHSHEGMGRFDSIDEFVRIEIKGWVDGQLEGGLPDDEYDALVQEARARLGVYRTASGEAHIPMHVHITTARKHCPLSG